MISCIFNLFKFKSAGIQHPLGSLQAGIPQTFVLHDTSEFTIYNELSWTYCTSTILCLHIARFILGVSGLNHTLTFSTWWLFAVIKGRVYAMRLVTRI
jgi:hypothetical protein